MNNETMVIITSKSTRLRSNEGAIMNEYMDEYEMEVLNELSKEQLIYIIEQERRTISLIGEVCVEVSKKHISYEEAMYEIRENLLVFPFMYNATSMAAYIDMQMGKITEDEYRKAIGLD